MPRSTFRRRFGRKKKSYTSKRKSFRRSFRRIPRGPGLNKVGIHYFERTVSCNDENTAGNLNFTAGTLVPALNSGYVTLTTPAAVGTSYASFGYHFTLAGIPNNTEFTNLFDSYQIRKVVVKMYPLNNSASTVEAGAPNGNPAVSGFAHLIHDYDDATMPTATEAGVNELRQFPNYKIRRLVGNGFKMVIKPRFATAAYRSGVTWGYSQGKRDAWLDIATPDVPHYGIKGIFEIVNPNAMASVTWIRVETTYYFKVKGVR